MTSGSLVQRTSEGGGLDVLTFNRPTKMNALSTPLLREFLAHLDAIEADAAVRVVVLTGAGPKAFVAGADIGEYEDGDAAAFDAFQRRGRHVNDRLEAFPKPVLAAVNGYALGGGFEIALCCDLIVASENARFGLPEGLLGLSPGGGGSQRLVRAVGRYAAAEVLLAARRLTAQRAFELGLACRVVPLERLMDEALELAGHIVRVAPLAAREMKALLRTGPDASLATALSLEQEVLLRLYRTDDAREGIRAFNEKRSPVFEGR